MLLPNRSIAGTIAVICFFVLGFMGMASGHASETCAIRAGVGAVVAYFIALAALKLINLILADAVVAHWMEQQEERGRDHTA